MAKKTNSQKCDLVPASDISKYRSAGTALVKKAEELSITTAAQETDAYTVLKLIAAKKKEIESRRKEITQPLNKSLKAANVLFKEVSAPLLEADSILRGKILDFQRRQQAKAAKEQERREKISLAKGGDGMVDEVEADVGVSTVTKRWTYEVVNIGQVPRNYLEVNSTAVREAIRNGVRDIPGLRIYQTEGLRV